MDNLQDKAISIKGKQYILVKDRVVAFNDTFTNGSIVTEIIENGEQVTVRATVTPDVDQPARIFVGHSQARWDDKTSMVNKSSALENAETSAVGRALAMMGIGVIESLASADEMNKAMNDSRSTKTAPTAPQPTKLTDADDPFDNMVQDFGGREVLEKITTKPTKDYSNYVTCKTCGVGTHDPKYPQCYKCTNKK